MVARVLVEQAALDRLTAMSLTPANIEHAVRFAEAESATCTAFDPPITAGFMRYARTVRGLREELVPNGWDWDNPNNFCRVIHPDREFAIVAMSGDEATGDAAMVPSTKYPRGVTTVRAVDTNLQLSFDFGDLVPDEPTDDQLVTWILLHHRTEDEIRLELSLPSAMTGGNISDWQERIILPPAPLDEQPLPGTATSPDDDQDGDVVVEVNRR
jgi:hypothetical protein